MHKQVRQWQSENSLWTDELDIWEREHALALADLARVERVVHNFAESARRFHESVRAHEQSLVAHEHALAGYLQGDAEPNFLQIAEQHAADADRHAAEQRTYNETKRDFQSVMSTMGEIRKVMGS